MAGVECDDGLQSMNDVVGAKLNVALFIGLYGLLFAPCMWQFVGRLI